MVAMVFEMCRAIVWSVRAQGWSSSTAGPLTPIRVTAGWCLAVVMAGAVTGCGGSTSLEQLTEARRLSDALLIQFVSSADAANRAVMAETDEASAESVRESKQATQAVQRDAGALRSIFMSLGYADEARLLQEFDARFTEYHALDETILGLAVENTNLKAQQLSFGAGQVEADVFRSALEAIAGAAPAADPWQARALAATAVSALREIQVLQAPHIAEGDDAAMTGLEQRMTAAAAVVRDTLETLARLGQPALEQPLKSATSAFDRFLAIHTQIIALSRRNSDVRSLALSLGRKRVLAASCEESLRAIHDALAKRGFTATR